MLARYYNINDLLCIILVFEFKVRYFLFQEQSAKKQKRREVLRSVANCMRDSLRDLYQNHSRPELYREVSTSLHCENKKTEFRPWKFIQVDDFVP